MTMSITDSLIRFAQLQLSLWGQFEGAKDLPIELVNLLVGRGEWETQERERRGNLDFQHNPLFWSGRYLEPVINQWLLENTADASLSASPWPQGKRFAVCLTHDVDLISYASWKPSIRRGIELVRLLFGDSNGIMPTAKSLASPAGVKHLVSLLASKAASATCTKGGRQDLFAPWLSLEARYGFRSTFFFLPNRSSRYHFFDGPVYRHEDCLGFEGERTTVAELMRELDRRGWEVGLHGTFSSFDDAHELKKQKDQVERSVQKEVVSTRQHYLHFDITKTPKAQNEAGFKYDSSFGSNRLIGFRNGIAFPFYFYDLGADAPLPLLEIPLHIQDGALFNPDNLDLSPPLALLSDRVEDTRGLVTLLWHPHVVDERRFPGWFWVYEELLKYISRKDAWVAPVRKIGDWWEQRRKLKFGG
jgi:peptidoglycan/xylan/chitin deacetylase (PgdA/CDA1 family)